MTRTTVVVITHNRCEELLCTLRHMTTLPDRAPIVVVDNASSDGTADAVAAAFPQVTLIRGRANLASLGRNLAVRGIQSRYVAFCDDDSRWQAGALTRAADLLDAHPGLASVTARILVEPDLREDPLTPELRNSPVPGPAWLPGPAQRARRGDHVPGGGVPPGRRVLAAAVARRRGGAAGHRPGRPRLVDVLGRGRGRPPRAVRLRDPRRRRQLGIRNTLWTAWLRRPATSALRHTGSLLRRVPPDRASAAAVAQAVAGLPWVLRERRVVPPQVEQGLRLLEEPSAAPPPAATSAEPGRSAQPVPVWA